jgi:hypothetical protein
MRCPSGAASEPRPIAELLSTIRTDFIGAPTREYAWPSAKLTGPDIVFRDLVLFILGYRVLEH